LGYVIGGLGVVGLAVGTVLTVDFLDEQRRAGRLCAEGATPLCREGAEPLVSRQESGALWADVTLGVGAVALAVGVTLILTHDEKTTLAAGARPGGGSVDLVTRF
jgi:hypothetical protein